MQHLRWLVSRLSLSRLTAALAAAGNLLAGLLRQLRPGTVILAFALTVITTGAWDLAGRGPALLLLGLLIIRDLERPDSPAKP